MTWAEFQQWDAATDAMIAAEMAKLTPRGGAGVIVAGNTIAIAPADRLKPALQPETWRLGILMTIDVAVTFDGVTRNDHWTTRLAAVVNRRPQALDTNYAMQHTQMVDGDVHSRNPVVHFEALGFELGDPIFSASQVFDVPAEVGAAARRTGVYRFPVALTIDHIVTDIGASTPDQGAVVRRDRLIVRRGGAIYRPKPVRPETFFELRISDVRRI